MLGKSLRRDFVSWEKGRKMDNRLCLFCVNSLSGDAPDGSQILVCFDCEGHEGREMIVGEEDTCANFKGE